MSALLAIATEQQYRAHLLPDELFANSRPEVHDFQFSGFQNSVLGEFHVRFSLVTLYGHVLQISEIHWRDYKIGSDVFPVRRHFRPINKILSPGVTHFRCSVTFGRKISFLDRKWSIAGREFRFLNRMIVYVVDGAVVGRIAHDLSRSAECTEKNKY